jgi:hypothetical protein
VAVAAAVLCALLVVPQVLTLDSLPAQLLASQGGLAVGGALALLLARLRGRGVQALGLAVPVARGAHAAAWLGYGAVLLCYTGVLVAWGHALRAAGKSEAQEVLQLLLALEGQELLLCALVAVLLGPFLEELLFRGFLQVALGETLGARTGALVSAFLFAALHGLPGLPGLVILSLFLTWLRARSGSLLVPYCVHALHNALTLGLALALEGAMQ